MAQTHKQAMATIFANTGQGPNFSVLEIGDPDRVAVVEADTAYWALLDRHNLPQALAGSMAQEFMTRAPEFQAEMNHLRAGLQLSAAYLNPTERCNTCVKH